MQAARKIYAFGLALLGLTACGDGNFAVPAAPAGPRGAETPQIFRRNAAAPLLALDQVYAGEVVPLELRGAPEEELVQWSSEDSRLGAFVKPGELHLRRAGEFDIVARAGEREVRLPVRVGAIRPGSPSAVFPGPSPAPTESPEASPSARPSPSPRATPSASPTPFPGATPPADPTPTPGGIPPPTPSDPFVDEVVSFHPGAGAGFGQDKLPDIVLGPPRGNGLLQGSLHVLSLGAGGEIVLKSATPILDGAGPDFIVFENAFYANGNPLAVFAEPAEVAVSRDGVEFFTFDCEAENRDEGYPGCAGVHPVLANPEWNELDPTDPEEAGGDPFDLSELGLDWVQYIRLRDLSETGSGGNAGFDLDAVGIVHQ